MTSTLVKKKRRYSKTRVVDIQRISNFSFKHYKIKLIFALYLKGVPSQRVSVIGFPFRFNLHVKITQGTPILGFIGLR